MSCSLAIRTAQSVVEEVPQASSSSIGALGRGDQRQPEKVVHKLSEKFKLTLPIPMTDVKMGAHKIPVLMMSNWARFILDMNLWHHLCGLTKRKQRQCHAILTEWWKRFKAMRPRHPIFQRTDLDLGNTCPLLLHGDEGRSLGKSPILILSTHSVLGYGLSTSETNQKKAYLRMNLNYEKPSWATRFLMSAVPKALYGDTEEIDEGEDSVDSDAIQDLLGILGADLRKLYEEGLVGLDGQRYYFCTINCMGDWPWLVKAGCLARSFQNVAKRATSSKKGKGICHMCNADLDDLVWEDFEAQRPLWFDTIGATNPFLRQPTLLLEIAHDDPAGFFAYDLFHAWHIGAAKSYLASSVVVLAMSDVFEGSRDTRMEAMTAAYQQWCRENRQNPTYKKFTLANLSWLTSNTFPRGTWSKGSSSTCICKWFISECRAHMNIVEQSEILNLAFEGACLIDQFLSGCYKCEVWIPSAEAARLARIGFQYLATVGKAARVAHASSRLLYIFMPNYHRLHEIFRLLHEQSLNCEWALSPLAVATQCDEDFVGRPSRLSRRVSSRQIISRTLSRSLEACYAKYVQEGLIVPEKYAS